MSLTEREIDLVGHYDQHEVYYSPLDHLSLASMHAILGTPDLPAGPVLDLGCGDGRLAAHLPDGIEIDGVDYSPTRISRAAGSHRYRRAVHGSAYDLARWFEGPYHTIYAFELLEHLARPCRVVARAIRLLAPGGQMIATVPIQMPYVAHLQEFEDVEDAVFTLGADQGVEILDGKHALLRWQR